jgi:DNA-binding NarL/FixJ family response regulator
MREIQELRSQHDASGESASKQTSSDARTTVFVVDDHPAIREALASAINSKLDMRLIGESGTAAGALRRMEQNPPDVAVVDISLDDAHGLDLVEQIRSRFPSVRVVVFSMYDESIYAERAIRAGASGYVMKSKPTQNVVEAVQAVQQGDVYLSRRMSSRILSKVIRQEDYELGSATEKLTDREMTVFRYLGEGKSVREIADVLDLSRKTVETYRRRAKEKLGFETVAELLQYAVQWAYGREEAGPDEEAAPGASEPEAPEQGEAEE